MLQPLPLLPDLASPLLFSSVLLPRLLLFLLVHVGSLNTVLALVQVHTYALRQCAKFPPKCLSLVSLPCFSVCEWVLRSTSKKPISIQRGDLFNLMMRILPLTSCFQWLIGVLFLLLCSLYIDMHLEVAKSMSSKILQWSLDGKSYLWYFMHDSTNILISYFTYYNTLFQGKMI